MDYLENLAPQIFENTQEIEAHLEKHMAQPMRNSILPQKKHSRFRWKEEVPIV